MQRSRVAFKGSRVAFRWSGGLVVDGQPVVALVEGAAEVVHGERVAVRGAPLEQIALEPLVGVLVHVPGGLAAEGARREGLRLAVHAAEHILVVAFLAHDLAAAESDRRAALARALARRAERVGEPHVHADRASHLGWGGGGAGSEGGGGESSGGAGGGRRVTQ